jgi:hypothetical protein
MSIRLIIGLVFCSSLLFSCKNSMRVSQNRSESQSSNSLSKTSVQEKYASILGIDPSEVKNITLYQFIDDWYGTPYKYGGQSKTGVDCSGFINSLFMDVYGKKVPRTTSQIAKEVRSVSKSRIEEGDIVIFDIQGKKHSHVGVYLKNGRFAHASSSNGVIISDLNSKYYQEAFGKAGRF